MYIYYIYKGSTDQRTCPRRLRGFKAAARLRLRKGVRTMHITSQGACKVRADAAQLEKPLTRHHKYVKVYTYIHIHIYSKRTAGGR